MPIDDEFEIIQIENMWGDLYNPPGVFDVNQNYIYIEILK